jgi:EAL domain-containing protein (putative c-di-GMP-specific phosphodiesterase class I)
MTEATRQVALWRRRPGLEDLRLAVNVSARELLHGNLSKVVRSALDSSGLDSDALWLEITERVLLEDTAAVIQRLEEVRGLGAHISIDDFGTGYSALSYLKRFPVEQVKIDRSFVSGISSPGADGRDASLVAAIIALARALDLGVVAEGVETPDQAHRLIELGCELAQGWHFAPPASPADLDPFLGAQVDHRP